MARRPPPRRRGRLSPLVLLLLYSSSSRRIASIGDEIGDVVSGRRAGCCGAHGFVRHPSPPRIARATTTTTTTTTIPPVDLPGRRRRRRSAAISDAGDFSSEAAPVTVRTEGDDDGDADGGGGRGHDDDDDDDDDDGVISPLLLDEAVEYAAGLVERRLRLRRRSVVDSTPLTTPPVPVPVPVPSASATVDNDDDDDDDKDRATADTRGPARGRFVDLTTSPGGERAIEDLFLPAPPPGGGDDEEEDGSRPPRDERVVRLAIMTLQSLLVHGMQIGVKGSDETQSRAVRHLFRVDDDPPSSSSPSTSSSYYSWSDVWDNECVRRLKFRRDASLGKALLGKLKRKRTSRGAFDLLVELGIWDRHEDTSLLRSGFPIRFGDGEIRASRMAEEAPGIDPDGLLGIRRDLRHFKVYTIDGESTSDIDDGISVEVLEGHGDREGGVGGTRYRYWIHIADVDRWAPRGSDLLSVAERRGTSIYLPAMTLCMFPENMSSGAMSLESWSDKCALSLGVELNSDGTIHAPSIIVTPSLVHVNYRLTYDQVDEMLDEGVGYTEEWEIGALLSAAIKRRGHRVRKGSTEGMVPYPIPKSMVTATKISGAKDGDASDGGGREGEYYEISLRIETTHNSGTNMTAIGTKTITTTKGGGDAYDDDHYDPYCSPVSSAQLIVTEMMILAGEAIGKWQMLQPKQNGTILDDGRIELPNILELPFRCQPAPEYKSRESETRQMEFLLRMNKRYPHAWYARRFFNKVSVSKNPGPHFGMGLDCYVQWTSPIRRLTDLQVHAALKRYLRRKRVNELLRAGHPIPSELTHMDLGYDTSKMTEIDPIDYTSGLGMIFAGRPVQSSSSNYWLFEYIRRLVDGADEEVMFESIVLGCVNKERFQYAVYVYELGLEHKYLSETGKLEEGRRLWLKVTSVNPRLELLTFSLSSRSSGHAPKQLSAPAA